MSSRPTAQISCDPRDQQDGEYVMTKPVIGFIGLGLMGGNMVMNLQKRGFEERQA
jgi:hypothetical protein